MESRKESSPASPMQQERTVWLVSSPRRCFVSCSALVLLVPLVLGFGAHPLSQTQKNRPGKLVQERHQYCGKANRIFEGSQIAQVLIRLQQLKPRICTEFHQGNRERESLCPEPCFPISLFCDLLDSHFLVLHFLCFLFKSLPVYLTIDLPILTCNACYVASAMARNNGSWIHTCILPQHVILSSITPFMADRDVYHIVISYNMEYHITT